MFRALAPTGATRSVERRGVSWSGNAEGRGTPVRHGGSYHYSTVDAFCIAAVVACLGLRSGAFAQVPLKGYTEDEAGLPKLLPAQPELLQDPSPTVVPSVWKIQMSISRDIWGYAAGKILGVDAGGYASKVEWYEPNVLRGTQDYASGPLVWRLDGQVIDSSLVFHVPSRWVTPGNPLGMCPLEKSGLVDLAKRAQDFGRDWFTNGAMPSAILYSDEEIDTDVADGLLAKMVARWRNRQMAVIGSGMKYEQVSVNANESQFLETCRQAASDIAISFNLPPSKINAIVSGSDITYQNREQNTQQYLMDSINPDFVVVQETVGRHMRPSTYPRWATGAFLRSDLKTRYESYKVGLDAEFLDKDEVRAWEELPPMPTKNDLVDVRNLAEMIQKIYLGVGVVVSDTEARALLTSAGGTFPGALPAPGGAQ